MRWRSSFSRRVFSMAMFQAMLANAVRLCDAKFGVLNLYEGGVFLGGEVGD